MIANQSCTEQRGRERTIAQLCLIQSSLGADVGLLRLQVRHSGEGHTFQAGDKVVLSIDGPTRARHARLHSAGHLLDSCLAAVGGEYAGMEATKGWHGEDAYVEYRGKVNAHAGRRRLAATAPVYFYGSRLRINKNATNMNLPSLPDEISTKVRRKCTKWGWKLDADPIRGPYIGFFFFSSSNDRCGLHAERQDGGVGLSSGGDCWHGPVLILPLREAALWQHSSTQRGMNA